MLRLCRASGPAPKLPLLLGLPRWAAHAGLAVAGAVVTVAAATSGRARLGPKQQAQAIKHVRAGGSASGKARAHVQRPTNLARGPQSDAVKWLDQHELLIDA